MSGGAHTAGPAINSDALKSELLRRAGNLHCAANAIRGTVEEREFFAEKVAVTCERTAQWLEELEATFDAWNTRTPDPELVEALELADALLSGANMNKRVVERKVKAAITKLRSIPGRIEGVGR